MTDAFLDYSFDGGKHFADDSNAGAAVHFYAPNQARDGINWAMWVLPLPEEELAAQHASLDELPTQPLLHFMQVAKCLFSYVGGCSSSLLEAGIAEREPSEFE